ncbi:cytochrome P450 [Streptomyces sp. NBC_01317]|uniref:cytochrome P450 n=1 Tax=Streptomyces sp. NBC_01317 TaxID=2903822 RepID=UPI002E0F0740|nr:cytochrome P450 [Streptomyces sp. NBC_01317]
MPKPPEIPLHNRRVGLDPLPELGRTSRECPFAETPAPGTSARAWLASGNETVRTVLGDAARFSTLPPADSKEDSRRLIQPGNLLQYDPPEHTRLRQLLTPEFTLRRMRRLEPLIADIVADRLDALELAGPPADFMRHFAWPVPGLVSCALLGIPRDDHAELARNLDVTRATNRSREQQQAAGKAYMAYMHKLIGQKRRAPGDDLLSRLIREHGDDITDDELVGTAATTMAAGFENVAGTLGLGALALMRHPDQLALFQDSPEVVDRAVEELIRYVSVIATASPRTALEDLTIEGHEVKAGETVVCSLMAVNRFEPTEPPQPSREELDITREISSHLAFGHGIHYCLGAPLTRLTLRIAFPALLARFPKLRPAVPPEELRYRTLAPNYGVDALPVTW